MLDNFQLIQKLARFDRERTPERVVHARGVGAHGEFVSYGDLSTLTKAALFSATGKKTPVFLRFSTVIHSNGSPESLRDPRGFAVKFYTEQGNWDLVGNNMPVFFIRDAMKFPDMVHSLKPSPVTNQQDPNRFFDFFSHVPESTQMLTFVYSDQGTPASLRQMDGFGVHAFKMVNTAGDVTYVKFHWNSLQGHATHSAEEAAVATSKNHSNLTQDLYDHIKVGRMTLNRVPDNFFESTEQVAFSPGMVVPGIEASEDRLLQGRLFSYADTQRYRLGTNYLMLPINRPLAEVANNSQAGQGNVAATRSDVNYEPSVTNGDRRADSNSEYSKAPLSGSVVQQPIAKTLNFQQAGELYRSFTESQKANLIKNLAGDLGQVKNRDVKRAMLSHFIQADAEYGSRLAKALGVDLSEITVKPAAQ